MNEAIENLKDLEKVRIDRLRELASEMNKTFEEVFGVTSLYDAYSGEKIEKLIFKVDGEGDLVMDIRYE